MADDAITTNPNDDGDEIRVDDGDEADTSRRNHDDVGRRTMVNFIWMSILFSANHGCVVSCLSLATSRLGSLGAWQSGVLYLTYTGSAIFGATYIVKRLGSRDAMIAGMALYCAYVGCFWIATAWEEQERFAALTGAGLGGIGAGLIWTAEGSYFAVAAEDYARQQSHQISVETATSKFAGIFAFIYLAEELALRAIPSFLLEFTAMSWSTIFGMYGAIAIASAALMGTVHRYDHEQPDGDPGGSTTVETSQSVLYKATAALRLLISDPKCGCLIGLNAVFGFAAAFLNSYVNGEVVDVVLNDPDSKYIGILTAWLSAVAAAMSLVFGKVGQTVGKGPILYMGAVCFFFVAFPFIVQPELQKWNWFSLVMVYTFHGTGRATFEGTLKATFADYFPHEKEGAFANIILQNGLSSAIGYVLTFKLLCSEPSRYCVTFRDGSLHDVLTFEMIVVVTAVVAIVGYWFAATLRQRETYAAVSTEEDNELLEDREGRPLETE